jgi:ADP-heptose:LPS heptosyltransferase
VAILFFSGMNTNQKIKVLVIRFSSIGDIVLCSPVFRCLKKIPGKEIEVHLTTRKSFVSFTKNYPSLDKVIPLDNDTGDLIKELKKEEYDFVIDLHNNLRSIKVRNALGKPCQAFHKLNIQKWLLTNFKINRMPNVHIVDRLMDAASPLGIENDGLGLDFFIPDAERVEINSLPGQFHSGYIAFVIGGTHFTKRLPAEKILTICKKLKKPVVLLGGPEDATAGEFIALHSKNTVYNACGKYSLNGSASLVEQSAVVISHDTGLMHIAAALGKPIASIWGNTVPELGMYPYYPKNFPTEQSRIFEVKGLNCRPCSKIGYKKCPKKHFKCMQEIPTDEVAAWAGSFL